MPRLDLRTLTVLLAAAVTACRPPAPPAEAGAGDGNGSAAYTGPVIDVHVHAFTEASAPGFFGVEHPPTLRGETFAGVASPEEQRRETVARLRANNVVKAVVTDGGLWLDADPELEDLILVGGGMLPPDALRAQHAAGNLDVLAELAPFYQGLMADDPAVERYFALAAELGVPVGFHIFPGGPTSGPYRGMPMLDRVRAYNADPLQLEDVLVRYPDVKVYVMHGGWPYVEDMKALMYAHPQVYVDVSVVNWLLPEAELHAYLKELLDAGFGDRILYGSDQMVWPQTIDIGIASVNSAPFLTLEQKEDIFYDNAAALLGLSAEEIEAHKAGG
ncbi:MAG TPA: amidohydrolase family protein [Longimicrobiales bacterium]|nr:amidohydrolase family protein [Longimicrobiales bacterium]